MSRKFPTVSNFNSVTEKSQHTTLRAVTLHAKSNLFLFERADTTLDLSQKSFGKVRGSSLGNARETAVTDKNFSLFSMALYLSGNPDSVRHYLSGNPDQVRHYVTGVPDSVRYYASGNPDGNPKSIHCARGVMPHDSPQTSNQLSAPHYPPTCNQHTAFLKF